MITVTCDICKSNTNTKQICDSCFTDSQSLLLQFTMRVEDLEQQISISDTYIAELENKVKQKEK